MASASVEDRGGGRWRIRWREKRPDGGWCSREIAVQGTAEDAESYRIAVVRDLREKGDHDPTAHRARHAPPANLLDGMFAYIDAAEADGLRATSAATYRAVVPLVAEAIHEVSAIAETEPLPVTLLSRRLFDGLKPVLARRGKTVPHAYLRVLWAAWGWLADDPAGWPHTPPRPSSLRGYVPPAAIYGRTIAPALEHADACIRRLKGRRSRAGTLLAVAIMRYTGLRLRQVTGLRRDDLDLGARTLLVRTGKSKQEQAEMRVVPLARHLLNEPLFLAAVAAAAPEGRLVKCSNPRTVVRAAWTEASERDGVPRHVWAPPNRINGRPDHGFRAAFQAHLTAARVSADVVDFLVGHRGDLRGTHYGRDLIEEARAAVDALPPIDWGGERE